MKQNRVLSKFKQICFLIILFALFLSGCGSNNDKNFTKQEDFNDAKIGVLTGSSFDLLVTEHFPKAEKAYQNSITDLIISLKQNKIDGIMMDSAFFTPLMWEQVGLSYVNMDMPATEYGIAFPKTSDSEKLKNEVNEFIRKQKENEWLNDQKEKWFSDSEPASDIDFSQLSGENGVLRVATTVESKPFNYLKNDKYYGYNAEFIYKFADEYGYSLEIDMMDFGALLPSLSSGKYDLAISSITVTEERKESVDFSDIYCSSSVIMAVYNEDDEAIEIDSLSDLENGTIGIVTGSNWDSVAKTKFPNAERKYFNSVADAILALKQGTIDAFFTDKIYYAGMKWENESIAFIDEPLETIYNSLVLSKNNYEKLLYNQLNEFIGKKKEDGTIKILAQKWFGDKEPSEHPDYTKLNGSNGTLKVAIGDSMRPSCYQRGTLYTGYEVEFLTLFAEEYGYQLDFQGMSFDALIPSVMSGKCDIGACGITVTPERLENVVFTDPNCETDGIAIIYKEVADETNFWENLKEDFEKTFIRESRWKLIINGIGITMLISICSIIGGSLLGFGLYMMSRSNIEVIRKITKGITKVYSRIIAGTPVVVILMILFYIVFGSVRDMSGILVAILGFTLVFGAFVYEHLHVSVSSVDGGQVEAAYALGYTKNKTFFRIVLPQAMKVFLPSYCAQSVEMIKATAVVGYIAVNDLTKIGDIIRSNTLEAFFPLLATAIIYFLLTWLLSLLLNLVSKQFEPKRRSAESILKGVKVHD